ncbi:uncharacterized protein LOC131290478 [Anopheles ziemanni]|uniref:uncharacterized protein LOC131290478 n=1 Tax=Anopheles ziemanni TaxID=345580 RepID=UPI00265E555D|nr:uncharacterized protein LOC131290478 [Anopheles ziemanni]
MRREEGLIWDFTPFFPQQTYVHHVRKLHRFTLALVVLTVVLAARIRAAPQADDQAKASRNNLLLRRGNVGRPLGRTTPTTTTTTTPSPADYAEDEYADNYDEGKGEDGGDDGGDEAGGKQPTTTTTTTEAPKKIRPSIRPFRSNDDLLSALKKRRQESKNNKPVAAAPKEKVYDDEEPAPAPAAPAKTAKAPAIAPNKRRFGSGARKDDHTVTDASNDGEQSGADANGGGAGAKSLIGRLGRSRFALKQ